MGPHAWRREGQGGPGRGTTLISCWEGAELPGSVVWKNVPIPTPAGGHALRQSIHLDFSPPDSQDWLLSLSISQGSSPLALPVRSRVGRLGKAAGAFGGRSAQGRHAGQVGQGDRSTAVPYRVGAGGTSPPWSQPHFTRRAAILCAPGSCLAALPAAASLPSLLAVRDVGYLDRR